MISSDALIEKFQYALDNHYGYIWATAGEKWTAAKQEKLDKTTDADRANSRKYGSQWIGHYVADCSGLFSWAFKQLGGYMYHGSDTMFRKYCTATGELNNGRRTDGQGLKPGTAVFVYKSDKKKYTHVGLYVGNGLVIEAAGARQGVISGKVTNSKWTNWGELKNVDYSNSSEKPNNSDTGFPDHSVWHPTIRRGDKGQDVRDCQTMLYNLGYSLGSCGIDGDFGRATEAAVKEFQRDHKLTVDGVVGIMTWTELEKATEQISSKPKDQYYTVCIHHLDKTQADALMNNYPGATCTEE